MVDSDFWHSRSVLITGHTGFKGSWLSLWLHLLGAEVHGYSLQPPTTPAMFERCSIEPLLASHFEADVLNLDLLKDRILQAKPEVVFHLAAQSLVLESYADPVNTYATNVMGTVHLLEAVRSCPSVQAVVVVTSDKCYEDQGSRQGYQEGDRLGGYDPYSNSKACAELVTSAYRSSFFHPDKYDQHGVALASGRAGNVIGGGDWSAGRLVPDCVSAFLEGKEVVLRSPGDIRPWQHVIEPLAGYLMLAEKLCVDGVKYSGPWNFGPDDEDLKTVEYIARELADRWFSPASYRISSDSREHHETHCLTINSTSAKSRLGWRPRWNVETTLDKIVEWAQASMQGRDLLDVSLSQLKEYSAHSA